MEKIVKFDSAILTEKRKTNCERIASYILVASCLKMNKLVKKVKTKISNRLNMIFKMKNTSYLQ